MPASQLFKYPYNAFLMLRLEFVAICQEEELEAMLLRIIEKHVEIKRQFLFSEVAGKKKSSNDQEIERDLWVPISHKLFMNDLFGIVTSENTIKKALKSLEKKKLIFSRFNPTRRYDTPEYRLHATVIQSLLDVVGKSGYQTLIPSIIDTLKSLDPQELTPSGCQKLIASCQLRVSKSDPTIRKSPDNKKSNKKTEEEIDVSPTPSPSSASLTLSSSSHQSINSNQEGGTSSPPASVGVPSISPEDVPPDTQPFLPDCSGGCASTEHVSDLSVICPDNVLIVAPVDTTKPNEQQDTSGVRGYTNPDIPNEPPDSDALIPDEQQAVVPESVGSNGQVPSRTARGKRTSKKEVEPPIKLEPPQAPPPDMPWGTQKCLLIFDALRGKRLIDLGQMKRASSNAKGLAEQYTEEQVVAVHKYMGSLAYWQKRGAVDIFNVAANIATEIRKIKVAQVAPLPPAGGSMGESQARALASKAVAMACEHEHEIRVQASGATIVVHWMTEGFEKPDIFESEACWSQAFVEMCEVWSSLTKKKRKVS